MASTSTPSRARSRHGPCQRPPAVRPVRAVLPTRGLDARRGARAGARAADAGHPATADRPAATRRGGHPGRPDRRLQLAVAPRLDGRRVGDRDRSRSRIRSTGPSLARSRPPGSPIRTARSTPTPSPTPGSPGPRATPASARAWKSTTASTGSSTPARRRPHERRRRRVRVRRHGHRGRPVAVRPPLRGLDPARDPGRAASVRGRVVAPPLRRRSPGRLASGGAGRTGAVAIVPAGGPLSAAIATLPTGGSASGSASFASGTWAPGSYDAVLVCGWRRSSVVGRRSTSTRRARSRRSRSPSRPTWRASRSGSRGGPRRAGSGTGWPSRRRAPATSSSRPTAPAATAAPAAISSTRTRARPWKARTVFDRDRPGRQDQLAAPARVVPHRHVLRRRLFAPRRLAALPGGRPSDSLSVGPRPSVGALPCCRNESHPSGVFLRINDARTIRREHPESSPDSAQETRHGYQRYQAKIGSGSFSSVRLPRARMPLPGCADRVAPAGSILPPPGGRQRRDGGSRDLAGARLAAPPRDRPRVPGKLVARRVATKGRRARRSPRGPTLR